MCLSLGLALSYFLKSNFIFPTPLEGDSSYHFTGEAAEAWGGEGTYSRPHRESVAGYLSPWGL